MRESQTIENIAVKRIDGTEETLSAHSGKIMLIVNVASACGFTPQYQGLEALYRKYQAQGLVVLGFPCNQFGQQEKGDEEEIKSFCSLTYDVTFPMFAKIEVNGANTHPLYAFLKEERPGFLGSEAIKWNFTKFLVNREGKVVQRYAPTTKPEDIEKDIIPLL